MIKLLVVLLLVSVMLSTAEAKRFHTMEAYYVWHRTHVSRSGHRDRVRNSDVDAHVSAELRRVEYLRRQQPIAYPYAVGNRISQERSGAYPYDYDRLCSQPNITVIQLYSESK